MACFINGHTYLLTKRKIYVCGQTPDRVNGPDVRQRP
jgi:hypothetical protein